MKVFSQWFATDKDIYDLLISGRKSITEAVLHELSRDRGIFLSKQATREQVINFLSLLSHDFHDIAGLVERSEHSRRGEKTASVALDVQLSNDEIKALVNAYEADANKTESVRSVPKKDGLDLTIDYDEFDYSRTRLTQKRRRTAPVEILIQGSRTSLRFPATEKGYAIVDRLKHLVEIDKRQRIERIAIDLGGFRLPQQRTRFFITLISSISDYQLKTVTSLRVATFNEEISDDEPDLEEDQDREAQRDMIGVVNSVAIRGSNLMSTPHYKDLERRGFFITGITWRSERLSKPEDMVEFDASFEDGIEGTGFRYAVRQAKALTNGEYGKAYRAAEEVTKHRLFPLIEKSAQSAVDELFAASKTSPAEPGAAK